MNIFVDGKESKQLDEQKRTVDRLTNSVNVNVKTAIVKRRPIAVQGTRN